MDDRTFWDLIAKIDGEALRGGDEESALEGLQAALASAPLADIEGFEEMLAQKLYALDGQRFADAAGESGDSDDGFLYARCFVVATGQARYEAVLRDPSEMPASIDDWCEGLLYVAQQAYEQATGKPWSFDASVSYETGSNEALWP